MSQRQKVEWVWRTRAPGLKHYLARLRNLMSATQTAVERWQRFAFHCGDESMLEIRAIIAEDEPLARRGIRQLLASHEDVAVVAETRNGRETVRALRELKPELVLLDVEMPNVDGLDVDYGIGPKSMPVLLFVTAF